MGRWGDGEGGGPLWGTRGPHSPKGVGIRGEGAVGRWGDGEMGRKQFKIQNLGRGYEECEEWGECEENNIMTNDK